MLPVASRDNSTSLPSKDVNCVVPALQKGQILSDVMNDYGEL
jgi:hypothetical protein